MSGEGLAEWAFSKGFRPNLNKSEDEWAEELKKFAANYSTAGKRGANILSLPDNDVKEGFALAKNIPKSIDRTLELRGFARDLTRGDLEPPSGRFGLGLEDDAELGLKKATASNLERRFNLPSDEAKEIARGLGIT